MKTTEERPVVEFAGPDVSPRYCLKVCGGTQFVGLGSPWLCRGNTDRQQDCTQFWFTPEQAEARRSFYEQRLRVKLEVKEAL